MSGVPVSTLRMWEGRYGAFTPAKSGGQHRLYRDEDVVRARLLRQLTDCGHSIGGIARLPATELQRMVVESRSAGVRSAKADAPRRLVVAVIGGALATRLLNPQWQSRMSGTLLEVRAAFSSLDEALAEPTAGDGGIDVLLARVNALHPDAAARLGDAMATTGARHGVVLYNFGAEATVAALRASGFLVRREPIENGELAQLLRSILLAESVETRAGDAPAAAIPARRYSEVALAEVAAHPPHMLCECPRHLSDILLQLSSFEDYSAQCLNRSEEDARIHAHLRSVAGTARAMFEDALDRVLAHEADLARERAGAPAGA